MLSAADCETSIKAKMQLHGTDITMSLLPLREHFIFTTRCVACARELDAVRNTITRYAT